MVLILFRTLFSPPKHDFNLLKRSHCLRKEHHLYYRNHRGRFGTRKEQQRKYKTQLYMDNRTSPEEKNTCRISLSPMFFFSFFQTKLSFLNALNTYFFPLWTNKILLPLTPPRILLSFKKKKTGWNGSIFWICHFESSVDVSIFFFLAFFFSGSGGWGGGWGVWGGFTVIYVKVFLHESQPRVTAGWFFFVFFLVLPQKQL